MKREMIEMKGNTANIIANEVVGGNFDGRKKREASEVILWKQ